MLPCKDCGYRGSIPGNCHVKCEFDWGKSGKDRPRNHHSPHTRQWFVFPHNYDPVWGPDECPALAANADPDMIAEHDPLVALLAMLR